MLRLGVAPCGVDGEFVAAGLAAVSVVAALECLVIEVEVEVGVDTEVLTDGGLHDVVLR